MAQAAHRLPQPTFQPEAANDNRPRREQDRWRILIDSLKAAVPVVAIIAIECRLRGWLVDDFCDAFIQFAEMDERRKASR